MVKLSEILNKGVFLLFHGLVLFGLYLSSLYSYLLFHSLVEIFSIFVGYVIFVFSWHSRKRMDNNYLLFMGIAFLFISSLDLIHTLAYKGMGVFPGYGANLPTQLWIAARYLQSLTLLISPVFLQRKLNIYLGFAVFAVATVLALATIFTGAFPACFVEGVGMTPFKKISEYIISLILLASIVLLLRRRTSFDRNVLQWLVMSIVLTIGAELTFTLYISVYGISNLIGHFFKLIAFYLIYIAIVETGLEKPHYLLFRNLKQNEETLEKTIKEVKHLAITDSLTGLYNRRHFYKLAEDESHRAYRYQHPLSVIMLDIDYFKQINDTFGHTVGDEVLQRVAECCRQQLRKVDVLGRYGGDEFVMLLPESNLTAACQAAERLRTTIAQVTLNTTKGTAKVTASLGVAAMDTENLTLETLLIHADQALLVAKQNGRNRVCCD
ncbi:MAG: GGDEF domain-containing protein [Thermodesulfobacteriota bacterium]